MALGGLCAASAHPAPAPGDLGRSPTTLAVGYRAGAPSGPLVVTTPGGPVAVLARPLAGGVTAVALERPAADAAALDAVRAALLADPDVRFVYHALVHRPSGQTLLPTDQILVKVRPGVDPAEVSKILPVELTVVRRLAGADDEYVLRLTRPRAADPVAAAALLAREPWVAWAEPDFVREYAR